MQLLFLALEMEMIREGQILMEIASLTISPFRKKPGEVSVQDHETP